MTTSTTRPPVRTYGGWRRTRGIGLFGLDTTATLTLLTAAIGLLLLATISVISAAMLTLPVLAVVAVSVVEIHGTTPARAAARWLRWTWGQAHGHTTYRSAALIDHPGAWDLPGILAPTQLLSAADETGHDFGLVWNRRTGFITVTLDCAAASTWLVDAAESDAWVANWHSWLASLGYLPMVRTVAVTIDTAPEPGATLQDTVHARLAPGAPADTVTLLHELVARSPAAAARIRTRVSITIDPAASPQRPRTIQDAAADVSRTVTGLESALSTCGVTVLGRYSALELAATVRSAFDPASRGEIDRVLQGASTTDSSTPDSSTTDLLTWADAGPVAADERWDSYQHDSGVSVTWGWQEAPRQQVTSTVLVRLLAPGRFHRRVTLVYRPLSAGQAARLLDNQVNAAAFRDAYRRAQHRDESARDLADRARAQHAAAEEAQGAGVVLMSLYVTTTVRDEQRLGEAVADVEARADHSKIRLRRLYGAQAAGFAATLPAGVLPGIRARR